MLARKIKSPLNSLNDVIFFFTSIDKEDAKKMAIDAMFKLEHGVEDEQKSKQVLPTLDQLKVQGFFSFNTNSKLNFARMFRTS